MHKFHFPYLLELFYIISVMRSSSGGDIRESEEGKGGGRDRPARHGKSDPLHDLSEEVSTRYVLKHASSWDLIALALRFEALQVVVG